MFDGERIPFIHVFPEIPVQRVRKSGLAMRVNSLESIGFTVPKGSLGLNLVIQI